MTLKKLIFVVALFCCFTGLTSLQSYTRYNKSCVSECAKKDSNFYWCYYDSGSDIWDVLWWEWEYCSPACTDDHHCGIQTFKVIASNGHDCIGECELSLLGKYYWCYTNNGWQYCSPNVEQDYQADTGPSDATRLEPQSTDMPPSQHAGDIQSRPPPLHPTGAEGTGDTHVPRTDNGFLPERPLQLIRPDPHHHRKLEINSSNVKHLHHIHTAVAVVTVVGKFHSGKSFLLNQLMGKREGFGVGPLVRAETMGIWMWGKPMMITLPSGEPLSVIFLDTEGFAASNISDTYDAKIFSVATLLSSYLMYNSVKIIDQQDIDYLELLARRTQLFALKSQMTKSKWFEEFNHDFLQFPPLVWVLQDFVQQTEETPTEWLHRIMETNSRKEGDNGVNLLGIFNNVDCHTLFLPATRMELLQDLSKATEGDLTPEYKEERDRLVKKLKSGLVPKEKNGRPITGPELATLLEILVNAANEGSLAEIPGRWQVFIDQWKSNAPEDGAAFYESDITVLLNNSAMNETELLQLHHSSLGKATTFVNQLLFGLEEAIVEAVEGLNRTAAEKFEKIRDLNDNKIKVKCGEVQRQLELEAQEKLKDVKMPKRKHDLVKEQDRVNEACVHSYNDRVGHLRDNEAFRTHLSLLHTGLQYVFGAVNQRNQEAVKDMLNLSIKEAIEKFREGCVNQNELPRTTSSFTAIIQSASSEAIKVFEEVSTFAREIELYEHFLGLLKSRIEEETKYFKQKNNELTTAACQTQVEELVSKFMTSTGPTKLVLPIEEDELEKSLNDKVVKAKLMYSKTQAAFEDTPAFSEMKSRLSEELEDKCKERRRGNLQAYSKEVEVPLHEARKHILRSAHEYDTTFSLDKYMEKVSFFSLDNGKAKDWKRERKEKIVKNFIQESQELQDLMKSKEGIWSSFKGFFQWSYFAILGEN